MIPMELIDYDKCHEYARSLCGQYGIPLCDAEDIGSDAFLLSIRRSWRTEEAENIEAVAKRLMYTSVLNVIDRRNKRSEKIIRQADSIDEGRQTVDDGEPTDDEAVEDDGRAVSPLTAAIGAQGTARPTIPSEDWQNPFWLRLFNSERKKLRREKKKSPIAKQTLNIIKAGLKDSRLSLIKANLNISGSKFCAILDFFKERFDLCFQALREYRGEN